MPEQQTLPWMNRQVTLLPLLFQLLSILLQNSEMLSSFTRVCISSLYWHVSTIHKFHDIFQRRLIYFDHIHTHFPLLLPTLSLAPLPPLLLFCLFCFLNQWILWGLFTGACVMAYLQVHEKPIRDHTTHETVSLFPTSQPLFHSTHSCEWYQELTCLLLRISSFAAKFLPTEYANPTQYGRNSKRSFSHWPAAHQVSQAGWSTSLRDPPRSARLPVDLLSSMGFQAHSISSSLYTWVLETRGRCFCQESSPIPSLKVSLTSSPDCSSHHSLIWFSLP